MKEQEDILRKRREEDFYSKYKHKLSQSEEEAQARYNQYMSKDPYPNVESALLNSGDIFKYVMKTGMVYPFYCEKLEGASYEVDIKGTVMWWDENGEKQERELKNKDDSFELKPNSIAFITLEPMFRIPDYIALRFNLKIVHVYKGLLLGTGPLVDPGFIGRLSLPLHNLTDNTYKFKVGDGIIQMEFTKLSRNSAWTPKMDFNGMYIRKRIKPGRTVQEYIQRSLGEKNTVIRSSIPGEISKIQEEAKRSKVEADEFRKKMQERVKEVKNETEKRIDDIKNETTERIKTVPIVNIATIASVATIMGFAGTAMYQWNTHYTEVKKQVEALEEENATLFQQYEQKENDLMKKVEELEKQLEALENLVRQEN